MKKVGILTHYYNSFNYGGVLQAYALCRVLNEMGYDAEQIQFKTRQMIIDDSIRENQSFKQIKSFINRSFTNKMELRNKEMKNFREKYIPHSKEIYTDDTISQCNTVYTFFITGSDQVWNLNWHEPVYFLDFVNDDIPKISYAASLGMEKITSHQSCLLKQYLLNFKAVSVREQEAVQLVQPATDKHVYQVIDPTLLLDRKQWEDLCIDNPVDAPYLLCYFLGERSDIRKLAKRYSRKHDLKIVTFPYACGCFRKCDLNFGDIKVYKAGPNEFLSLIKSAKCIMTDSFHATVFSNIFNKTFFVFQRYESGKMSSRITTILEQYGKENNFCAKSEMLNLEYIESIPARFNDEDNTVLPKIQVLKEQSQAYLRNNLL
ncbi:polysaccharide pyruvyl transferase family protein [Enterocloster bolteae]|uniref:polysaccharide pyruvyl transferase family protein n=1 Tax=Enterocloster bolteae TaxID=208479 RepID=UPI00210B59E4|nr:polysaccharide pyruvyl transferase family protein [Enterocloster bolteae]MCQ5140779.1 polysaccharide pyruvyl transferase family protein [Enterocloster bolteae]